MNLALRATLKLPTAECGGHGVNGLRRDAGVLRFPLSFRTAISGECVKFRLFSPKPIQALAQSLAADIARRYPAEIANSPEAMVSQQRRSEILDNIFFRARQFNPESRLGVLARIRLARALKWQLKEMGYDEKFIDTAMEHLVASVTNEPK